jgi:hypothetical protein
LAKVTAKATDDSTAKAMGKGTAEAQINRGAAVAMMTATMAINQWQIIDYYLVGHSGREE